jgi:hypothetical protein
MCWNNFVRPLFLLIILSAPLNYLSPQASQYSALPLNTKTPAHLNIHDDSLLVRGVYWELALAGVHSLFVDSNTLTVTGDSVSSSGDVVLSTIVRTIPSALTATRLVPDTSRDWFESDALSCFGNPRHCFRSFYRWRTHDSFCFEEPFHSYYQIRHTYRGQGDTTVMVFAFGKMNQDSAKWMGYILITNRHPS